MGNLSGENNSDVMEMKVRRKLSGKLGCYCWVKLGEGAESRAGCSLENYFRIVQSLFLYNIIL